MIHIHLAGLCRKDVCKLPIVTAESIPSAKEVIKCEGDAISIVVMDWLYPIELISPEDFVDELKKKGYNVAIVTAVRELGYIRDHVGSDVPVFHKPHIKGLCEWAKNILEARNKNVKYKCG